MVNLNETKLSELEDVMNLEKTRLKHDLKMWKELIFSIYEKIKKLKDFGYRQVEIGNITFHFKDEEYDEQDDKVLYFDSIFISSLDKRIMRIICAVDENPQNPYNTLESVDDKRTTQVYSIKNYAEIKENLDTLNVENINLACEKLIKELKSL